MNCPKCKSPMVLRKGNWGPFWGCSAYPRCKHIVKASREDAERVSGPAAPKPVAGSAGAPKYKPSAEQQAIIDAVLKGDAEFFEVVAGAGCAKTTSLRYVAWELYRINPDYRIAALAFNTAIVGELTAGMPPNVLCTTTHSFGKSVINALTENKVRVDPDKIWKYIQRYYPIRDGRSLRSSAEKAENARNRAIGSIIKQIVGLMKSYLCFNLEQVPELLLIQGVEFPDGCDSDTIIKHSLDICMESMNDMASIDYDDMLAIPANIIQILARQKMVLPNMPTFDFVLGDEAQDWSTAQHWLMLGASGFLSPQRSCKTIVVGDSLQAIYGFRGADYDSMANFKELVEQRTDKIITLPLMETYRCAQSIVRLANQVAPDLRAHPSNPEGSVEMVDAIPFDELRDNPSDWMISSRTNRPLFEMAQTLLRMKVPCYIRGRDIAEKMRILVVGSGAKSIADLRASVDAKLEKENDKTEKDIDLIDRLESVKFLAEDCRTVDAVIEMINTLFSENDGVMLTSIHKSKGLEARCVLMIPTHAPHPMAKTEMAKRQEYNLLYVQVTRAKERLYILRDPKVPFALKV